jgi:hypothetical protein
MLLRYVRAWFILLPSSVGAVVCGSRVRLRLSAAWHTAGESANRQHGRHAFELGCSLCYCGTTSSTWQI